MHDDANLSHDALIAARRLMNACGVPEWFETDMQVKLLLCLPVLAENSVTECPIPLAVGLSAIRRSCRLVGTVAAGFHLLTRSRRAYAERLLQGIPFPEVSDDRKEVKKH